MIGSLDCLCILWLARITLILVLWHSIDNCYFGFTGELYPNFGTEQLKTETFILGIRSDDKEVNVLMEHFPSQSSRGQWHVGSTKDWGRVRCRVFKCRAQERTIHIAHRLSQFELFKRKNVIVTSPDKCCFICINSKQLSLYAISCVSTLSRSLKST